MTVKNRACPKCRENGHDDKGDHLFLAAEGDKWLCPKVQYHSDSQYCIIMNDPETDEPIIDTPEEEPKEETFEKAPESSLTERSGGAGTLDGLLSNQPVGDDEDAQNDDKETFFKIDVTDLPTSVKFRGIPEEIRSKYGCRHSLSEEDRSVNKVYYPVYKGGVQVRWKERDVLNKGFTVRKL